jgi:hypothetical protein
MAPVVATGSDLVGEGAAGGGAAVAASALEVAGVAARSALHDIPTTANATIATIDAARRVTATSVEEISTFEFGRDFTGPDIFVPRCRCSSAIT